MDTTLTYSTPTTTSSAAFLGIGTGLFIFYLVVAVVALVAIWKVFSKAGQPGWAAIIPFYNIYTLCKVAGRPGWWLILFLIPFVNIIVSLVVAIDVAKGFGKSPAFGVIGLWLFSIIGFLMLAFGSSKYVGAPSHT